jgi:hypothetical protein
MPQTGAAGEGSRASLAAAAVTVALLLATTDERAFGLIPDGQQMLSAGASLSRFCEIGISRDFLKAPPRPGGDAVSGYGMLPSLVETVPMLLARGLHRLSPGTLSTPLFALVPILFLGWAAGATTRTLSLLGASAPLSIAAGLALVFATPLWGYAGSDYSEPLQAAVLSVFLLAVVKLRTRRNGSEETEDERDGDERKNGEGHGAQWTRRWQIVAGVSAGLAVLTKSLLLVAVAPLLLAAVAEPAPFFLEGEEGNKKQRRRKRRREVARVGGEVGNGGGVGSGVGLRALASRSLPLLLSFSAGLLLWSFFDLVRFGRLFGGYVNEHFDYPLLTGLLRLTVFANKGLLFYAPLVFFLSPVGFVLLRRRDARLAWALAASAGAILVVSSAWWAWDGQAAWGPRLLVPTLPPLVLLAGLGAAGGGHLARAGGLVLGGAGVIVNALGAFQPFPGVYALASLVPSQPITEARAAGTQYEIEPAPGGVLLASGPHHLSLTPSWTAIRLHTLVLGRRALAANDFSFPDLAPPFLPAWPPEPAPALVSGTSPLAWAFWGRSFVSPLPGLVDPYRQAMRDQTVRAVDLRDLGRASRLARELMETDGKPPDAFDVALGAEAELLSNRPEEADRLLAMSPEPCHPWINFVRAERGSDLPCLPEPTRTLFLQGVKAARAAGLPLTGWARAALRGRTKGP